MKIAELRAKSKEELKDLVLGLKKEQFNLRMQAATGALASKSRVKEVRRTIARAKTLLTEQPKPAQRPLLKKRPPRKRRRDKPCQGVY